MNQTLHIFAKDTRRFWQEILISIALLGAFAHVSPLAYQTGMLRRDLVLYPIFNIILNVLIPITWWILVTRVVHEENLVGDRQFWITRPYRWPSLLGAKILFFFAYILLPIGLMQSAILFTSGLHPATHVSGLLFSVALLGTLAILPLFALSTVTASFAKLTLALAGIVLVVVIFGAFIATRATNIDTSVHAAWPYLLLSLTVSSEIIVLQYARRRTLIARLALLGSLILLILLPVFLATKITPLYFPPVNAARPAPVTFAFDPNPSRRAHGTNMDRNGQYISVVLPVVSNGVAPASLAVTEGIQFTLTSSDGSTYTSPWRSNAAVYRPEANGALKYIYLLVPEAFFDQVKSTAVTAHITLGVGQLRPHTSMTIPFPAGKVDIPGIGICSGGGNTADYDRSSYFLACTVALRSPVYTEVTARWSDSKCNQPQPSLDQLILGDGVIGSYDSDPADLGLSPLIQQQINFSKGLVQLPNNVARQRYLCAGTPLTFTPYSLAYRASVDFIAPNLNLRDYLPKSVADAQIGFHSFTDPEE